MLNRLIARYRVVEVAFDRNIDSFFITVHDNRYKNFQQALNAYENLRRSAQPEPGYYHIVTMVDRYNVLLYQSFIERKKEDAEAKIL